MKQNTLGMYIHIPFCKSKCPYCDFCSFPHPTEEATEAYVDELIRRMAAWGDSCATRTVDTLYLGGGTPTLLSLPQAERLMHAVYRVFSVASDAEVTLECNPATASKSALRGWRALGVNRLSMGAQSAQEEELRALGRLHGWDDVCRTVEDAHGVGIDNVNLDFMMGIPHQTKESLTDTLKKAISLSPDHLSAYCLMLEEGTPFAKRGAKTLGLPDDDFVADLYRMAADIITEAGYEHYEISNFARTGRRSRHNLHTWQAKEYLGLGVAAHSYIDGKRFGNSRDIDAFLRGEDITEEVSLLSRKEAAAEAVILGLRLSDGIDPTDIEARFGVNIVSALREACSPFMDRGLMTAQGTRIRISEEGWLISNAILSELWSVL